MRNFPLTDIHPNATPAARAAYCAGQQNPRLFWALHDWLFANQSKWGSASDAAAQVRQQALVIGADAARFDACLKDAKTDAIIQRDLQAGASQGVRGTPAFFLVKVNAQGQAGTTRSLSGALPYEQFAQAIETLLSGQ